MGGRWVVPVATVSGDRVTDDELQAWLIESVDIMYQSMIDIDEASKKIWLDWAAKHAAESLQSKADQ